MKDGEIIIRSEQELRGVLAGHRMLVALCEVELAVATTIARNIPKSPYELYGQTVKVNPVKECVDVELEYVNRKPKGIVRSVPLSKFTGREINFLFDCSGLNEVKPEVTNGV